MSRGHGRLFELRVFEAFNKELNELRLGILPRNSKLKLHGRYYSRDRRALLDVDLALEIWLEGANNFSFLWIFECKDYASSVPVNDAEELHAKIQQIGEDNTKGVLVSSSAFQRGALRYAKSKGIGLARLFADDRVVWLSHLLPSSMEERAKTCEHALLDPEYVAENACFFSSMGDSICLSTKEFMAFVHRRRL